MMRPVTVSRPLRATVCLLTVLLTAAILRPAVAGADGSAPVTTSAVGSAPSRIPVRQDQNNQQAMVLLPTGKAPTWVDIRRVYHALKPALPLVRRFASERSALSAGYHRMPGIQANMFVTFSRPVPAETLLISRPSSLVYMEMGGAPVLAGLTYTVRASTTPTQLDALLPSSLAEWHQPLNVCLAGKRLSPERAASIHEATVCAARGGTFAATGNWSITAWLGQPKLGLFQSQALGMAGMNMGAAGQQKLMEMTQEPYQMEMLMTNGAPISWADVSRTYKLLVKAEAATKKYRDLARARKDGFITAPFLYVPGQGAHYVQPSALSLEGSTGFDVTHPPVLVYNQVGGKLVLSSLLYLMPLSSTTAQLARVFPASMAAWHRHVNTCVVGVKVVAIHDRTTCEASHGFFVANTGWMVHAWLYDRTTGVFNMDQD